MKSLFVLLAINFLSAFGVNPGVRIQANQNAITYMKTIGINVLNQKVRGLHVPNYSGSSGDFSYQVTNIRISSFSAPNSQASIALHDPNSIAMHVSISAGMDADYHVKWKKGWVHISKSGSVSASATGTASVSTGLLTKNGKPQVNLQSCSGGVTVNKLHFHGDLIDQIANLFEHYIKDYFEGKLRGVICDQLSKVVRDDANAYLSKIQTSSSVGSGFNIDYSLVGNPVVQNNKVASFGMLGKVWFTGHQNDPKIPAAHPTPAVQGSDKMFCINMDAEEVLGSGGYALLVSGKAHMLVDKSVLDKLHLSQMLACSCPGSQCLGSIIPQIQSKCAGGTVLLNIKLSTAPTAHVNTSGAFISLAGEADLVAKVPAGQEVPLFTVTATASAVVPNPVTFDDWKIKGQVHVTGASLKVSSTQVGTIDDKGLDQLWQMLLILVVEQELNKMAEAGVPLPQIPDVQVLQPQLIFGQHTLSLCFNAKYTGPQKYR